MRVTLPGIPLICVSLAIVELVGKVLHVELSYQHTPKRCSVPHVPA